MSIRLYYVAVLLSISISCGFAASVAVDLVDSKLALENITIADNSTTSLNVSASFLKVRDVDVQLKKVGPMCQCTCTDVTDIDGTIKNTSRLDISTDKFQNGSESSFFKVREVGALQLSDQGFNLSVKLSVGNGTNSDNSTEKDVKGSGSNFTLSLPASISPRNIDVQLKSLETNVSDVVVSAVNSTLNSTSNLSKPNSTFMEERGIDDFVPFDEALFGDVANISQIASAIFDFDAEKNVSLPTNASTTVESESSDANWSNLEEPDMDLEGLISLKDEDKNSTAKGNNSSSELEKSDQGADVLI